jgi:hypothetical protein
MKFSRRPMPTDFSAPSEEPTSPLPYMPPSVGTVGFRAADVADGLYGDAQRLHHAIVDTSDSHDSSEFEVEDAPAAAWPVWLGAVVVAALWALGPIAFAVGYRQGVAPLQDNLFAFCVFALLAIGPAALVFFAAYLIRQGQKLGHEARTARSMAEEMVSPALIAAARAGDITLAVRDEIQRTARAADEARETLLAMRDALAFETEKLAGATAQSVRTAQELATTLGRERSEMSGLSQTLDGQATRVADAITRQARMVAEATGVAETQIREAETNLAARAADLAAAASATRDAARTAGEDLTRHIARLETAGAGVAEQVGSVESGLSEHRASLAALSQSLKSDQEAIASATSGHAARLEAFIATARHAVEVLGREANAGGDAVNKMLADAAAQLGDLVETVRAERQEFGQSTLHSIEAVSQAAITHRQQMEIETRAAIEQLASAAIATQEATATQTRHAREQVEQLSEAAFSAGQRANQVFEARIEEARALVSESSRMVAETGEATAASLEAGVAAARATVEQLTSVLGDLEARARQLPDLALEQMEQVRETVFRSLDDLQGRAQDASLPLTPGHSPSSLLAANPIGPAGAPGPTGLEAASDGDDDTLELSVSAAAPSVSGAELASRLGLRNRIRLTPIASDQEFSAVFQAAGGRNAGSASDDESNDEGEVWTWKDLLASLDGATGEGERLKAALAEDLAAMGVDAPALLPRSRIEDVAATLQAGDIVGAREIVRALAPAATRRIARRMFTDDEVRRRTEQFLRRYKTLTSEAIARESGTGQLSDLLNSDAGRMYLLLDTAAGDML